MFWPDVIDLKLFYSSKLGRVVRRLICQRMRAIWPDLSGHTILGLGYTHPYLDMYFEEAQRSIALMPAGQGAVRWAQDGKNLSFLANEAEIPLPTASFSRILLVHAFENTEQLRPMLSELARVLTPGGRILVVVPNRSGVWARMFGSPFAHGSPYSAMQLKKILRDNGFTHCASEVAVFLPPTQKDLVMRSYPLYEWVGKRFFPAFSGLILMEVEKQVYAPSKQLKVTQLQGSKYFPAAQPAISRSS